MGILKIESGILRVFENLGYGIFKNEFGRVWRFWKFWVKEFLEK